MSRDGRGEGGGWRVVPAPSPSSPLVGGDGGRRARAHGLVVAFHWNRDGKCIRLTLDILLLSLRGKKEKKEKKKEHTHKIQTLGEDLEFAFPPLESF